MHGFRSRQKLLNFHGSGDLPHRKWTPRTEKKRFANYASRAIVSADSFAIQPPDDVSRCLAGASMNLRNVTDQCSGISPPHGGDGSERRRTGDGFDVPSTLPREMDFVGVHVLSLKKLTSTRNEGRQRDAEGQLQFFASRCSWFANSHAPVFELGRRCHSVSVQEIDGQTYDAVCVD